MDKIKLMLSHVIDELSRRDSMLTQDVIDMLKPIVSLANTIDFERKDELQLRLLKLRDEYQAITGKKPFSWWSENILIKSIEKEKALLSNNK